MSDERISGDILTQYKAALGMFRDAVTAFPADEWKKGDTDYQRPAGVAYHVVEAMDFYAGTLPPEKFPWGKRFNADWEDPDPKKLPDQQDLLAYLDETEEKLNKWFRDNDLLAEETMMPWTGKTLLGRTAYGIRHIQHHMSEMSMELTRRGLKSPDWQ